MALRMIPTCTRCGRWIEHNNRSHPGYCAPGCHQQARADRDEALAEAAAKRRDRRQQEKTRPVVLT